MPSYVVQDTSAQQSISLDLETALNPQQQAIVLAGSGPVLVIAGAGTGKTRTLTYRCAHLIRSGVHPSRLLLCTFTNRAARELVHRLEQLLGRSLREMWAGTFHHVAHLALKEFGSRIGYQQSTILDREDAADLINACILHEQQHAQGIFIPQAKVIQRLLSLAISRQTTIQQIVRDDSPRLIATADFITSICTRYSERKKELRLVDYDDLLTLFHQLLTHHDDVSTAISDRFEHVLVDEYQDTNQLQSDVVDQCSRIHRNLTVVGDDAQSIYSFRGAVVTNILTFPQRYPNTRTFRLEHNYRSTPEILRLANETIRHNQRQFKKVLTTMRPNGSVPVLAPLRDSSQQSAFVAQRLIELHQEKAIPLDQVAILYRAHSHSMELQIELTRRNIPFRVQSGLRFFEYAHIKDVIAYLRVSCNPKDLLAWQRVLRTFPGIGKRSAEIILAHVIDTERTAPGSITPKPEHLDSLPPSGKTSMKRLNELFETIPANSPPDTAIETLLTRFYNDYATTNFRNTEARLDDLAQLKVFAQRYDSLISFVDDLALVSGLVAEGHRLGSPSERSVVLSTIHQAKGLEWRAVFLMWLTEGKFPQAAAVREATRLEEERRLFYVAVTRAKDHLYLCRPQFDDSPRSSRKILRCSRFVEELKCVDTPCFETWDIQSNS